MPALHDWQNFYILTGTAAATLIGLLFVAISIGGYIPEKEARAYTRTFVDPILINYAQVLILSCLALMPLQNALVFPIAVALLGVMNIYLVFKVLWRMRVVHRNDGTIDRNDWQWHLALPGVASLLFVGGPVSFFYNQTPALLVIACAALSCLVIGLRNIWTLMIWLTVHSREKFPTSEDANFKERVQ